MTQWTLLCNVVNLTSDYVEPVQGDDSERVLEKLTLTFFYLLVKNKLNKLKMKWFGILMIGQIGLLTTGGHYGINISSRYLKMSSSSEGMCEGMCNYVCACDWDPFHGVFLPPFGVPRIGSRSTLFRMTWLLMNECYTQTFNFASLDDKTHLTAVWSLAITSRWCPLQWFRDLAL